MLKFTLHRAFFFIAILLAPSLSESSSDGQSYVGGSAGIAIFQDSELSGSGVSVTTHPGFVISGFSGYKFKSGFRAEFEGSYSRAELDKVETSFGSANVDGHYAVVPVMGNLLYEFPDGTIRPYFGGGVGGAFHEISAPGISETDFTAAFQVLAGLNFSATNHVSLGIGYKFFITPDPDFGGVTAEISSHNIVASLTYYFGGHKTRARAARKARRMNPNQDIHDPAGHYGDPMPTAREEHVERPQPPGMVGYGEEKVLFESKP